MVYLQCNKEWVYSAAQIVKVLKYAEPDRSKDAYLVHHWWCGLKVKVKVKMPI